MIATAIITAPRPVPTIMNSLASYRQAGFMNEVLIFDDGECNVIGNVRIIKNASRLGNLRNWVNALRYLTKVTEDEWLMVCEDDISWANNAAAILRYDQGTSGTRPSTGMISLYCPVRMSKVLERDHARGGTLAYGWYGASLGKSTWGAQCLVFHRNWALQLLADANLHTYLADLSRDRNVDAIVADVVNRRGREVVYRIPCLVDHTFGDANSSLGYKDDRPNLKTKYFKAVQ